MRGLLLPALLALAVVFAPRSARASDLVPPPPPPPPSPPWTAPSTRTTPALPPGALPAEPGPCSQRCGLRDPCPLAEECSPKSCVDVSFSGYLQFWWLAYEQVENGLMQPWTGDAASREASGFAIRRARLAADIDARWLCGRLEIALDGTPRMMDAWAAKSFFGGGLDVWAGQMKIPSTYEVETASSDLDFVTRSTFSALVANWSLCRSPSDASPFSGVRTYFRDVGIGLKGRLGGFRYFLMAGNGLGANLFIGAAESKQYVFANDLGAYALSGRVSYDFAHLLRRRGVGRWLQRFEVGGHYCRNDHPNVVFSDETSVYDIDRWSWSADCRIDLCDRVRLTGLIGSGAVEDDLDHDEKRDYQYSGWELKAMVSILRNRLEAGVRYDVYEEEHFENGASDTLSSTTIGLNWTPHRNFRMQLNYKWKSYESRTDPDLDDDVLLLVAQLRF